MGPSIVLLAAALVPIAPLTAAAQTLDLPVRKAGLWQVTTISEGGMKVPPIAVAASQGENRDHRRFSVELYH
ncbi:MAG: hypothetical protein AB7O44_14745 [Hyphomicrobiaceae bacterium]